jgi:hypothetical protein
MFNSLSRLDSCGFGAVNNALITLLLKKPGAEEVRDFRPISLIHGIAKWVAKVTANRLAPHLPQLVGAHQSAFVHRRCLHDNFMMVQGTARKLHKSKQPAILIKLDITKAFDTVDWSFLLEVLRKMGFGQTWPMGRAFRGPAQSTPARHVKSPARHASKRAVPARERPRAVPGPRLRARGLARHGTWSGSPSKHMGWPARHAIGTPRAGPLPLRRCPLLCLTEPLPAALPRCIAAPLHAFFQNLKGSRAGARGIFWLMASRADMAIGFGGLLVIFSVVFEF